ncbi:YfbM family protein [Micromonospora cathayae]|uniref:YfbM family protein n=1 Tax=Micromonospora cathayae TaxID=3028804 RepID=A0ABY7ZPJ1_9ACTN|nr:YfbM family protein [Micromonospora sp. HUAS 3]WDZ84919.1 YfbM family protein [Micromonospora sp. HUAS 3]
MPATRPRGGTRSALDKAWHAIHFLLTGTAWETGTGAGAAVLGGGPVGGDIGYGPARLLDPEQVRTIAAGLEAVTVETLRTRYDVPALRAADVYPNIWDDGDDEFDSYLAPHYTLLRQFYRAAAGAGQAVLLAVV